MSKIEVNEIDKTSGSTLTLGGSGTAVTLACGATQTGFGRTGTVNWQTTKKTTSFTAANGEGYFVDTAASGAVTMTLPASPSAGNIVAVKDYNGNFATANLTIARNGSPINGGSGTDVTINTDGASIVLVYVDASQGWVATQDDSSNISGESFITATGGTITTSGNDKIHKFTGPGTFAVSAISGEAANNVVSYIVVGGGGGGSGMDGNNSQGGGGGGAGGFRETKSPATPYTASPLDGYSTPANRISVTATSFPITVGGGGTAGSQGAGGNTGSNSIFSTITAAGGGGVTGGCSGSGKNGGSGGGGSANSGSLGSGNTPPVTPSQGNNGGNSYGAAGNPSGSPDRYGAGGGGGATGTGFAGHGDGVPANSGKNGLGATSSITASPVLYSEGGGGANYNSPGSSPGFSQGSGGNAGYGPYPSSNACGQAGTVNTGGGGGGGSAGGHPSSSNAGAGGSGIVIIRYKFQ